MASTHRLLPYLERIGTGPGGAGNLTYEEAYDAMRVILDGAWHPVTLGAFLMAMRWKPETAEELAGFLDALRDRAAGAGEAGPAAAPPWSTLPPPLDCAGNYDGKSRTVNVGVAAAVVASAAGQPVVLHGAAGIPTKAGLAPVHVLRALGVAPAGDRASAARSLAACGLAYLDQADFHPALHGLLPVRQAMGKRTFLNAVEPLANPLDAPAHLGSCFHPPFAERVCRTLARSRQPVRRAVILQGIEGSDEARPGRSLVAELVDGEIRTGRLDASALGTPFRLDDLSLEGGGVGAWAEQSARWTERLLATGEPIPFRNAVLLSAAARLYAGGRAATWEDGVRLARAALESGAARRTLDAWRRETAPPG